MGHPYRVFVNIRNKLTHEKWPENLICIRCNQYTVTFILAWHAGVLWIKQPHPRYPLLLICRNHLSQSILIFLNPELPLGLGFECSAPPLYLSLSNSAQAAWTCIRITCGACSTCRLLAFTQTHCLILLGVGPMSTHRAPRAEICCLTNPSLRLACDPRLPRGLCLLTPGWRALPPTVK